jgi:hypothetical protein
MSDNAYKSRTLSTFYGCTDFSVYRFNFAGATSPSPCVYSCCTAYREGRYKTCVRQIALGRAFLPSPWTHTFNFGITYSPANSSFKTQKRKIYSRSHLAMLLLHCELHKLSREWQANAGCKGHTGRRFPHEDRGWDKRTWRTETHCCQRGELQPIVPISFEPSILEERN